MSKRALVLSFAALCGLTWILAPAAAQTIQNETASFPRSVDSSQGPTGLAYDGRQVFYALGQGVHVLEAGPDGWRRVQRLDPGDPTTLGYGYSLARSGDELFVAGRTAQGTRLDVYRRQSGAWSLGQVLSLPGRSPVDLSAREDLMACTSWDIPVSPSSHVSFLERRAGAWHLVGTETRSAINFGAAVAVIGERVVVGNPTGVYGQAHVFERRGSGFSETAQLIKEDLYLNGFGAALASDGELVYVGAPAPPASLGFHPTLVYVFALDGTDWRQVGLISDPDPTKDVGFGWPLELAGERLLVGGAWFGNRTTSPYARARGLTAFLRTDAGWIPERRLAPPRDIRQVALVGDVAVAITDQGGLVFDLAAAPGPATYCDPQPSAGGCSAALSVAGGSSAGGRRPFEVLVHGAEGQRLGLVFFGRALPTWNGFTGLLGAPPGTCVGGSLVRTGVSSTGGREGRCDGALAVDFGAWMASHPGQAPVPGERIYLQAWLREPGPHGASLSNALALTVEP